MIARNRRRCIWATDPLWSELGRMAKAEDRNVSEQVRHLVRQAKSGPDLGALRFELERLAHGAEPKLRDSLLRLADRMRGPEKEKKP